MKEKIRMQLQVAANICEYKERSTEYTIQFLQDYAKVDHACAVKFLIKYWRMEKENEKKT